MAEKKPYYHEPTMDGAGSANPPPYYSPTNPPPGPYPPAAVYPHLPQQGPPMAQAPAPQVVAVPMMQPMGPQSARTTCRFCNSQISTRIESNSTSKTHLIALVLFLLGCWCCCCIPYCVDSCMNTDHYCPSCNAFLGSYTS